MLAMQCGLAMRCAPTFMARVTPLPEATGLPYELPFLDDGSRDHTVGVLLALRHSFPCIRLVQLSRNFDKEAALTASLTYASGN